MAIGKDTKLAIQAKLKLGVDIKEISEHFGVSVPTIYTIKQKMKDETVEELLTIKPEIVAHVVKEAKEATTKTVVKEAFEAVEVGLDGLKRLDGSFQKTMTNVLKRFDMLLMDQETPLKDLVLISTTAASAYEKIFSSGTNIHIGDNNSQSSQQLTVFKNKQGV